jgi:hypothetical protein
MNDNDTATGAAKKSWNSDGISTCTSPRLERTAKGPTSR